jgi:hypothetical protein
MYHKVFCGSLNFRGQANIPLIDTLVFVFTGITEIFITCQELVSVKTRGIMASQTSSPAID